jgi:hypothetical protein
MGEKGSGMAYEGLRDIMDVDSRGRAYVPGTRSDGGKFPRYLSKQQQEQVEAHADQIRDGIEAREASHILNRVISDNGKNPITDKAELRDALVVATDDLDLEDYTDKEIKRYVKDLKKTVKEYDAKNIVEKSEEDNSPELAKLNNEVTELRGQVDELKKLVERLVADGPTPVSNEEDSGGKEKVSPEKIKSAMDTLLDGNPVVEKYKKARDQVVGRMPADKNNKPDADSQKKTNEAVKNYYAAMKELDTELIRLANAGELKISIDGTEHVLTPEQIRAYLDDGKIVELEVSGKSKESKESSEEKKAREKAERDARLEELKKLIASYEGVIANEIAGGEDDLSDKKKNMIEELRKSLKELTNEKSELDKAKKESKKDSKESDDQPGKKPSKSDLVDQKMKEGHSELLAKAEEARSKFLEIIAKEQKKTLSFRVRQNGFVDNALRYSRFGNKFGNKLANKLTEGGKEEKQAAREYVEALQAVMDERAKQYEALFEDNDKRKQNVRASIQGDYAKHMVDDQKIINKLQSDAVGKPMNKWLRRVGYAAAAIGGGSLIALTPVGWVGGLAFAGAGAGSLRILANRRNANTEVKNKEGEKASVADIKAQKNIDEFKSSIDAKMKDSNEPDMDAAGLVGHHINNTSFETSVNKIRVAELGGGAMAAGAAIKFGIDAMQGSGVLPTGDHNGNNTPGNGDHNGTGSTGAGTGAERGDETGRNIGIDQGANNTGTNGAEHQPIEDRYLDWAANDGYGNQKDNAADVFHDVLGYPREAVTPDWLENLAKEAGVNWQEGQTLSFKGSLLNNPDNSNLLRMLEFSRDNNIIP